MVYSIGGNKSSLVGIGRIDQAPCNLRRFNGHDLRLSQDDAAPAEVRRDRDIGGCADLQETKRALGCRHQGRIVQGPQTTQFECDTIRSQTGQGAFGTILNFCQGGVSFNVPVDHFPGIVNLDVITERGRENPVSLFFKGTLAGKEAGYAIDRTGIHLNVEGKRTNDLNPWDAQPAAG